MEPVSAGAWFVASFCGLSAYLRAGTWRYVPLKACDRIIFASEGPPRYNG